MEPLTGWVINLNDPVERGSQMLDTETARQIIDNMGVLPEHRKQLINEVASKDELRERCNHSTIIVHPRPGYKKETCGQCEGES